MCDFAALGAAGVGFATEKFFGYVAKLLVTEEPRSLPKLGLA